MIERSSRPDREGWNRFLVDIHPHDSRPAVDRQWTGDSRGPEAVRPRRSSASSTARTSPAYPPGSRIRSETIRARSSGSTDGLLHISGDGYGYIATEKAYRDYHLIVEYKWGKRTDGGKFVRNSGILLHATGPDGGPAGTWMSSIECQLAQGCVGDLIVIRGDGRDGANDPRADSPATSSSGPTSGRAGRKGGEPRTFTGDRQLWWSRHDPDFTGVARHPRQGRRGEPARRVDPGRMPLRGRHGSRSASTATTVNECLRCLPAGRQDPAPIRGLRAIRPQVRIASAEP